MLPAANPFGIDAIALHKYPNVLRYMGIDYYMNDRRFCRKAGNFYRNEALIIGSIEVSDNGHGQLSGFLQKYRIAILKRVGLFIVPDHDFMLAEK